MSFTLEDVAQKAIELAEANPEFVYKAPERALTDEQIEEAEREGVNPDAFWGEPSCRYIHDTEAGPVGGCLFGQALLALGESAEALRQSEGVGIASILAGNLNEPVPLALQNAQTAQDNGKPWGEAIEPLKEAMGK